MKDGQDRRLSGQEAGGEPNDGQDDRGPGKAGGVTWEAPEEMQQVDYTEQEQEFAEMVKGPPKEVFKHIPRGGVPDGGRGGATAPAAAQDLLREAQKLADGPVLKKLQEASDDLYAWASTRVAQDSSLTLSRLLEEMTQFGLGDLAEEAAQLLEKHGEVKAGSSQMCTVGEVHWEDDGPGQATVHIDGEVWAMYDFKEEVLMTEELAGLMGVVQPEVERRQCVTKVLAAAHLFEKSGARPDMQTVEILAQQYRLEQGRQAAEAESLMGHAEPKVSPIEHELRMYAHDVLKAHHDKDYRGLAVFPLEDFHNYQLVVLRIDYRGEVLPEIMQGREWRAGRPTVWAMVHRGHMTLLRPPQHSKVAQRFARPETYTTPVLGFHYFWHQRHDQPRTAPGVIACRHCKPPQPPSFARRPVWQRLPPLLLADVARSTLQCVLPLQQGRPVW